jgi:protoheme IX farnesyltransferase
MNLKATAPSLSAASANADKTWVAVYLELFKARLTLLVLITTLVGFYLGSHGPLNGLLLLHTMLGTALLAAGASALNQLWEREYDARMRRTQDRPLPSGRLQPQTVLLVGCGTAGLGMVELALGVNLATALLGAATLISYLFIYTPLKRVTWLNTAIGAVPGGLPPLMGWAAARGQLTLEGWTLFGILALWQVPHFMAIAWIYRDEYARAGFKMLPVLDPAGRRTGRQALVHTLLLLPLSVCPFLLKITGPIYLAGATVLGLLFLWFAFQFARHLTIPRARQLFYISIVYLPLLLTAMVLDKTH